MLNYKSLFQIQYTTLGYVLQRANAYLYEIFIIA